MKHRQQAIFDNDQFWGDPARSETNVERFVVGEFDNSKRQRQVVLVLTRIIVTEMDYHHR